MINLTQIVTTSKAWWQTGVNHINILSLLQWISNKKELRKNIETLEYKLTSSQALSRAKRKEIHDKIDDLRYEWKNLEQKFTSQPLVKINIKLRLNY